METGVQEDQIGRPHFFRIMMGDFAKHLRIPRAFTKHISAKASKEVTLVGPSGENWHVKLDMGGSNDAYLKDGWRDFVKDYSLQEYDFLVFRYDGEKHFNVQIFDKTACEREDAFIAKRSRQKSKTCEGRKKRIRLEKSSFLASVHLSQQKSGFDFVEDCSFAPGVDKVIPKSERNVNRKNAVVNATPADLHLRNKRFLVSSRRHIAVKEDNPQTLDKAKLFTSNNPYLKICLRSNHITRGYTVHMPAAFSRKYLPRRSGSMLLRDPQKRCWVVRYICRKYRVGGLHLFGPTSSKKEHYAYLRLLLILKWRFIFSAKSFDLLVQLPSLSQGGSSLFPVIFFDP